MLGGSGAAVLVSALLMPTSIMTEKIARRGARVLTDYAADFLDGVVVRDHASRALVTLAADETVGEARAALRSGAGSAHHTGFPVLDPAGALAGVITRSEVLDEHADAGAALRTLLTRPPLTIFEDSSLREAADRMVTEGVGRLVVVARAAPSRATGIVTRSDVLGAHRRRLEGARNTVVHLPLPRWLRRRAATAPASRPGTAA